MRAVALCVLLLILLAPALPARAGDWEDTTIKGVNQFRQGHYVEASADFRQALEIAGRAHASNDVMVRSLGNLVDSLVMHGDFAEARPISERLLKIQEAVTGTGNGNEAMANFLNRHGLIEERLSRFMEAEDYYLKALAIYSRISGPESLQATIAMGNLGMLYKAERWYAEAEEMDQHVLRIREAALGPDHQQVALALNNLVAVYGAQGEFVRAEPLQRRALAICEKTDGRDALTTATGVDNLGRIYFEQGEYARAEPMFKRAIAIREKSLAPNHPDLLTGMENLALLYRNTGRETEATALEEHVTAMRSTGKAAK